ncbi:MAG: HEAT repeat domain-containing protein [Xanthomonadales bacterium]|nr:HEAT repeat domain-containing protein [Xanthomonadales bacterium]
MIDPDFPAAGPKLAALLHHPDWHFRLAAAQALDYVVDPSMAPHLLGLLDDPRDVRLHWIAAEALGRLGSPVAVPRLQQLAESHWYPPVRQSARWALNNIRHPETLVSEREHLSKRGIDPWLQIGLGVQRCEHPLLARVSEDPDLLSFPTDQDQLQSLSYEVMIRSFVAEFETTIELETGPTHFIPEQRVPRHVARQRPHGALRASDGWLLWGGRRYDRDELVYREPNGKQQTISNDEVQNLYRLGEQIIAVVNFRSHLGTFGMLRRLDRDPADGWRISNWRALPSSVIDSELVETGELLLELREGGSILVAADGSMRMMPCADELAPSRQTVDRGDR